jgi:hypothetical protein
MHCKRLLLRIRNLSSLTAASAIAKNFFGLNQTTDGELSVQLGI